MDKLPKGTAPDVAEDWHEHAKIWDQDEDARHFAAQALASLLQHVNLHHDDGRLRRTLDFGCGTGLLTEKLAPLLREVVAVDISPEMLGVLRSKQLANVEIHCANIDDDSVRSAAPWFGDFDLIVASSVCGILPRYEHTVELLAQALNPGGFLVQWDWLLLDEDDDDGDDGLTLENVATAFTKAELTCVVVERTFDVLFDADRSPVLLGVARKPRKR